MNQSLSVIIPILMVIAMISAIIAIVIMVKVILQNSKDKNIFILSTGFFYQIMPDCEAHCMVAIKPFGASMDNILFATNLICKQFNLTRKDIFLRYGVDREYDSKSTLVFLEFFPKKIFAYVFEEEKIEILESMGYVEKDLTRIEFI